MLDSSNGQAVFSKRPDSFKNWCGNLNRIHYRYHKRLKMSTIEDLKKAVTIGKRKDARLITTALLEEGIAPEILLEEALIPAMSVVGEKFKRNEVFVPEMLVSARAMKESMRLLEPKLLEAGIKPEFKAVIGTVEGDLHDIGKNLVATMWKGAGFDVIDLGVNVSAADFSKAIDEHSPDIVGLSALLTTTMPAMRDIVSAVKRTGENVKVVIGGAPVTQAYADEIGADGYAGDAASAVDLARAVLAA
jgi:5-methyltetrahydrofolate--homocysteine methyltransferase